ncbi:MAG: N-acetylmuramoyl-L-alanine amidase [Verrucomicrobiota bacterium]
MTPPTAPSPPSTPPPTSSGPTVVIDPGHGGTARVGGSSPNNATSYSGKLEKHLTLELGKLVRDALSSLAPDLNVVMTRTADVNLGLSTRANRARDTGAEVFVSLHFNAFNASARGVETHVRPGGDGGNVNLSQDRGLANRIQSRVFSALRSHDSNAKDRGLKETRLAVLNDLSLGNSSSNSRNRACLLEIEFIDVQTVDRVLNIAPNPAQVKRDIAAAIAEGILADIDANS